MSLDLALKKEALTAAEIIACREALGWSQERFAELFGVKLTTARAWEAGRVRMRSYAEQLLRWQLGAMIDPARFGRFEAFASAERR